MIRLPSGIRKPAPPRQAVSNRVAVTERAPIVEPAVYIHDDFDDTDSTAISSHTPNVEVGGGWSQTDPTSFYILGNKLVPNRYVDGDKAVIEVGNSNYIIESLMQPYNLGTTRGNTGLVFRYVDANNYWYFYCESDTQDVSIVKVVDGVAYEEMIQHFRYFNKTIPLLVKIACIRQQIILTLNGEEIVTITSSAHRHATKAGIYLGVENAPVLKPNWISFEVRPFVGQYIDWPNYTENLQAASPIIALGAGGQWDDTDINDPSVQWDADNSRYVMAYTGNPGDSVQKLGIATATNLLGPWTKHASNPVLDSDPGDINGMNGGLIKFKGLWYYYFGKSTGLILHVATSPDLITWTQQGVVLQGTPGTWDSGGTYDAYARVSEDGNTIELWYIGKATGLGSHIGFATSKNGLNFTKNATNPVITLRPFGSTNIGEPCVFVPPGYEGKQKLVCFHASRFTAPTKRFLVEALTLDNCKTWHYRIIDVTQLTGLAGTGWQGVQNFDPDYIQDAEGALHLFYGAADVLGSTLDLNIQIGVIKTLLPVRKIV